MSTMSGSAQWRPSDGLDQVSAAGALTRRSLLDGVRVLDLTKATSGPFATQILADLGAEVIKIEEPPGPMGRPPIDPDHMLGGMDAYFLAVNRGKRSVAVKLASPEGLRIVDDLVGVCDIVVDNLRPGVAEKLQVDSARLRSLNPRLITCSLTGYGATGRMRRRAAYDITIQGETSAMAFIGKRDVQGRLVPIPMPVADLVAGMYCAVAIPAALYRRTVTGTGATLEVSMFDSLLTWLVGHGVQFLNFGELGRFHDTAIWGAFDTADRPLVVAAHRPAQWERFCRALGRQEWLHDPRFDSIDGRIANYVELLGLIQARMSERTADQWVHEFEREGVAFAHCLDIPEVLSSGFAFEQQMIVEVEDPSLGTVRMFGNPIRTDCDSTPAMAPPRLGADTVEVLLSIGRTNDQIERLKADGVIHCDPQLDATQGGVKSHEI